MERVNPIIQCCLKPPIMSLWKFTRGLLAASLSLYFAFSPTCRQQAIVACKSLYNGLLLQSLKVSCRWLNPPYLYLLLNMVIMTIAVTSGVVNPVKCSDLRIDCRSKKGVQQNDQMKSAKSQQAQITIERSEVSSFENVRMLDFAEYDVEKPQSSSMSVPEKFEESSKDGEVQSYLVGPSSITIQEIVSFSASEENMTDSHQIVVKDTLFEPDMPLVKLDESNASKPDTQLLQINDNEGQSEMSLEEVNARSEAFILNFYQQLRQQRKDSIRNYLEVGEWN